MTPGRTRGRVRIVAGQRHDNPIPPPGTGRPSIDQLYRKAAHVGPAGGPEHRAAFRRLVAAVWPRTGPGRT